MMTSAWYRYVAERNRIDNKLHTGQITSRQYHQAVDELRLGYITVTSL